MREWASRFLTLADAMAETGRFDLVARYVAYVTILAVNDQDLMAELEGLAVRHFEVPQVGEIIREKACAYLGEAGVALTWSSTMAESQAWFARRNLEPQGIWGRGFAFGPIDRSEPAAYNSFADAVMAIKLAEAWALNPHNHPEAPLTRTEEILSYVIEHALVDTEKKSVKSELHVAELRRALTKMVDAVKRSPSEQVRIRERALRDYLLRSKGLWEL